MDRADRKGVKGTAFDVVLRGYDKRQVEERLGILGAELVVARNALRVAQERAAMLEEISRSTPGADGQLDSNFGARVEKILMLAEQEAREVRRQADAAAVAVVEQARAEAAEQDSAVQRRSAELDQARQELDRARAELERESERVHAKAQAEVEQIRKAVALEADELFRAATQEAAEVCKTARVEAAELTAQARAEANRLVTTATEQGQQRERASAHELHQLSQLYDEINADLYRAKEVLDRLFGGTRPPLRVAEGPPDHRRQARTV